MGRSDRNFGLGTRLSSNFAVTNISQEAAKRLNVGSASADKMVTALRDLGGYLETDYGLKDLSELTQDQFASWAYDLVDRADAGHITPGHGGDLVSSVNSILRAFGMQSPSGGIRIVQNAVGLSRGARFTNEQTAMSVRDQDRIKAWLQDAYNKTSDIRYIATIHMISLAHEAGYREREASRAPLAARDYSHGMITIKEGEGAKNDRPREFHVSSTIGIQAAQSFVKEYAHYFERGTLISTEHGAWAQHNNFFQASMGAARKELGIQVTFHGIRHEFAQRQYANLWQNKTGVRIEARKVEQQQSKIERWISISDRTGLAHEDVCAMEKEIREDVSLMLGHNRVEVTNVYLGS